jgi:hypothetical protein
MFIDYNSESAYAEVGSFVEYKNPRNRSQSERLEIGKLKWIVVIFGRLVVIIQKMRKVPVKGLGVSVRLIFVDDVQAIRSCENSDRGVLRVRANCGENSAPSCFVTTGSDGFLVSAQIESNACLSIVTFATDHAPHMQFCPSRSNPH